MDNNENAQKMELSQFIVVKLGVEQYGINIQFVQNIVRMINITRVPKAPYYIKGVVNLRGDIIPVMSIRLKFDMEEDVLTDNTRIIFVKLEGNEIGLIVDEVKEVIQLSEADIDNISRESHEEKDAYVFGVGKVGESLVTLLNIEELIKVNDPLKA
ncbi:Chemotaxis protein CheW [Petrocella atlantisensis]|uniref:Chemotaxis protein CheW n=1 Tax=Petrocella atlantisensis TaxID=2173034 RepID=A0A3P7PP91_9FIRM|nr:chemotaxis protein CheW [Petrocella atlantisensis]PKM54082.1 MAG: chemotaxis protein CheW [Firmicutes bacterium HGW-Firmicutes-5]VDN46297.1 Chemotaxis protein CheW [Petrocella atlantisensis]